MTMPNDEEFKKFIAAQADIIQESTNRVEDNINELHNKWCPTPYNESCRFDFNMIVLREVQIELTNRRVNRAHRKGGWFN
jgi:hypothetical protein